MSDLPSVNTFYEKANPVLYTGRDVAGAPWQPDWRDVYIVGPDEIHNHQTLAVDESAPTEATIYRGLLHSLSARPGADPGTRWFNYTQHGGPLAIDDMTGRATTSGQVNPSGVGSVTAMVPFLNLPDYGYGVHPNSISGFSSGEPLPYHYDVGLQVDMGQAIGPRQVFRSPPSYSDQTAAFYAAGF